MPVPLLRFRAAECEDAPPLWSLPADTAPLFADLQALEARPGRQLLDVEVHLPERLKFVKRDEAVVVGVELVQQHLVGDLAHVDAQRRAQPLELLGVNGIIAVLVELREQPPRDQVRATLAGFRHWFQALSDAAPSPLRCSRTSCSRAGEDFRA